MKKARQLMCRLLGHRLPMGYAGGPPYLKAIQGPIDNVGREHWYLHSECACCGHDYHAAYVHGPLRARYHDGEFVN